MLKGVDLDIDMGQVISIIGRSGSGKSTLLRIVTGELSPDSSTVTRDGSLGVMRQFVTCSTVGKLLLSVAQPAIRDAAAQLARSEAMVNKKGTTQSQLVYASAISEWGEVGGYDVEVLWDVCTVAALGVPFERCRHRSLSTLSSGEQKRARAGGAAAWPR
ncbi:MAG: ATP-binding cassette domain-containing protein [Cutibacterium acnes]|nr:ATP-binding cassette domain-containing protein [Cutibacterium acnes]